MSVRILIGDVRERLRELPDESVHCVVTSPPYWGLRDYGTATWEGGDAGCDHDQRRRERDPNSKSATNAGASRDGLAGKECCRKCGARRVDSQLGLEPTPEEHVRVMVEVFREVRRVMRRDATLWCNYGDVYFNGGGEKHDGGHDYVDGGTKKLMAAKGMTIPRTGPISGLKPKDLVGMPWRLAFALQADGWWLRSDIIWAKPNPMPESVTDRPTKSHEHLFLLAKAERYYYDADAVREADVGALRPRTFVGNGKRPDERKAEGSGGCAGGNPAGRNLRDVWTIPTAPFPGAHFATFPQALVEPCIKAGTSEHGCCSKCGAPWVREREDDTGGAKGHAWLDHANDAERGGFKTASSKGYRRGSTVGWSPGCDCAAAVVPCTVLDPFAGAGTVGLVADKLGRDSILIELNPLYAEMARKRIYEDCPLFADVTAG